MVIETIVNFFWTDPVSEELAEAVIYKKGSCYVLEDTNPRATFRYEANKVEYILLYVLNKRHLFYKDEMKVAYAFINKGYPLKHNGKEYYIEEEEY